MLSVIEKFLFQQFPKMPQPVRVLTYLVMLVLFSYLLLIPKFIDGHIKVFVPSAGAMKDYRGAQLRMAVDGRIYKYCANEDGFWSLPVISKLPNAVVFEIYDKDKDEWHKLELSFLQVWQKGPYEIEVRDKPPFVSIAHRSKSSLVSHLYYVMNDLFSFFSRDALAGMLYLPSSKLSSSLSDNEKTEIQEKVLRIISKSLNKPLRKISMNTPLTGQGAPSNSEKILFISELENAFTLKIPDEHWQAFETVGQVVDYIKKRIILQKNSNNKNSNAGKDWEAIKNSYPTKSRPAYKY